MLGTLAGQSLSCKDFRNSRLCGQSSNLRNAHLAIFQVGVAYAVGIVLALVVSIRRTLRINEPGDNVLWRI